MAFENEARFHLPDDELPQTIDHLNNGTLLQGFILAPKPQQKHSDTYFDIDGKLLRKGWSLRIRRSCDSVKATLKRPSSKPEGATFGEVREEIENSATADLTDTVAIIIKELAYANIIDRNPPGILGSLLISGLTSTLAGLGIIDLFTVTTTRHPWIVTRNGDEIAELVVDDSTYDVGAASQTGRIRECRIEVELRDASSGSDLDEICTRLISIFPLREVHESKFERGMLHVSTGGLREKLELKIALTNDEYYDSIVSRVETDGARFLPLYRFSGSRYRHIEDVYFDDEQLHLFQAGHYLRLRQEQGSKELVFRRLTEDIPYGEALQEEFIAAGSGEEFERNWLSIRDWLTRSTGREVRADIAGLEDIGEALKANGLHPTLRVDIARRQWMVQRADALLTNNLPQEHIAKLKYDRITMHHPANAGVRLQSREFEATGVDRDDGAPLGARILAYDGFVAQFMEACAHVVPDHNVTRRISAKYFQGIVDLGITKVVPNWLAGNKLAYRVSLLRSKSGNPDAPVGYSRLEVSKEILEETQDSVTSLREIVAERLQASGGAERENWIDFARSMDERIQQIEAAIARLAPALNLTVIQNASPTASARASTTVDLSVVANELSTVLDHAVGSGLAEESDEVAAIMMARGAASRGDELAAASALRKVGKYIADIAKQISVPVTTALLEKHFGLGR
jgi:adenylate cyclase class IV